MEGPRRSQSNGSQPDKAQVNGGVRPRPAEHASTLTEDRPRPTRERGKATKATTATKPKSKMKRSTRIALAVIGVVSLIEAVAFAGSYLLYSRHYVTTNNAQVDGDEIAIVAPASGTLTRWTIDKGSSLEPNETVGRIRYIGSKAQPEQTIKSPGRGTVAVNSAVNGQYVTKGTQLAAAYGPGGIYVTARVDETDVRDVHVGHLVDISVDAFPKIPVTGVVTEVQNSAAGNFTIYPAPGTDPTNPQKVDQYIPVRIAFTYTGGMPMRPGQNVTVHIHKE